MIVFLIYLCIVALFLYYIHQTCEKNPSMMPGESLISIVGIRLNEEWAIAGDSFMVYDKDIQKLHKIDLSIVIDSWRNKNSKAADILEGLRVEAIRVSKKVS